MTLPRQSVFAPIALLSLALFGCAAPSTKEKPAGVIVDASEYEWVTPLGSNIPVRVRKGTAPQTASPTATISGDQAANMLHGAGGQAKAEKSP